MPPILPHAPGIYKITCILTGKFYIGSSKNIYKRCNKHKRLLIQNQHNNQYLQNAWNKYGEAAFVFEVLEIVAAHHLVNREQYYFDELKSYNREIGFNIASSAESPGSGHQHTPEARLKISIARAKQGNPWTGHQHKPETRIRISEGLRHRPVSVETRAKMSAASKGNKNRFGYKETPETIARKIASSHSKTYIVVSPNGTEMTITNMGKFCRENNLSRCHMSNVAAGKRPHHKGWKCRHV